MATHFKVDRRLAILLGESYRSTEEALKELVDNAWDADAEHVTIHLPAEMTADPIIIEDDGLGMTPAEVQNGYLVIARDRRTQSGIHTARKKRKVKGRKGIGKFAGLIAAQEMTLETKARGSFTRVRVTLGQLLEAGGIETDLQHVELPTETVACPESEHGTRIFLSGLSQRLAFPSAERLREILVRDYGRQADFQITVNGQLVTFEALPGESFEQTTTLPDLGEVRLKYTIADGKRPLKLPGLGIRVDGKLVGRPLPVGNEEDPTVPQKLWTRVYGEIEVNSLRDHVTADWGSILENSKPLKEVLAWAQPQVEEAVRSTFKKEIALQKGRLTLQQQRRLAALPENRRMLAEQALNRVLQRLFYDAPDRVEVVVALVLEAFERDDYWAVFQKLDVAAHSDVALLAGVLEEFGLIDIAIVAQQARGRMEFLDAFDSLIADPRTLEAQVHRAIERNMWLLGAEHRLIASNKSLTRIVGDWLERKFTGERANRRPDLLLASAGRQDNLLLVEFKRPSHPISRADENQAEEYRDDLAAYLPSSRISILLLGKRRDSSVSMLYRTEDLVVRSYGELASDARADLSWLLDELGMQRPL